jgi:cytochrome c oxidase assembly factor 2
MPRKRRRRPAVCLNENNENENGEKDVLGSRAEEVEVEGEDMGGREKLAKRECPVPKPPGILGEILGFKSSTGEGKNKPP